ncbi:tyrosine-type recombinase/integrase [Saccharopolyspora gregorii]|uniref:Integrase n=1 Tax=Saccharopolyspora gregorii TaxID=33914 RepID=A0ABP6RPC1_9PSEU
MAIKLDQLVAALPPEWAGFVRDWDRSLRAAGKPETTRYNYLLAVVQLGRHVGERDAGAPGAVDPTEVVRGQVEEFQAWMIETRSRATALNKHKCLQQFFRWLVEEEEIDRSPMERIRQPKKDVKLIPVMGQAETKKLLGECKGKDFVSLRDEAIIRLYCNTGARLSEVADLSVDDLDFGTDSVVYRGKGAKSRRVRFGHKTARALSRYLRARAKHPGSGLPNVWLAARGGRPLGANGIKIRLKRLGELAGVADVHAHQWRHTFAHEWKRAGGDTGDLMLLLGWTSDAMPRHYGASAAAERAQEVQLRMGIGDDV